MRVKTNGPNEKKVRFLSLFVGRLESGSTSFFMAFCCDVYRPCLCLEAIKFILSVRLADFFFEREFHFDLCTSKRKYEQSRDLMKGCSFR